MQKLRLMTLAVLVLGATQAVTAGGCKNETDPGGPTTTAGLAGGTGGVGASTGGAGATGATGGVGGHGGAGGLAGTGGSAGSGGQLPAHCSNSALDADETDLDCGGADCAPCEVGALCLGFKDCASRYCDASSGAGGSGGAAGTGGGSRAGGSGGAAGSAGSGGNGGSGGGAAAGVTVGSISNDTSESGESATFTVVLNAKPLGNVTVHFDTDDATEGKPNVTSLFFTAGNWDAPQSVSVTGQDDDMADGDVAYHIVFTATTSPDARHEGIIPDEIAVTNTDNDTAGINVSAISGPTTEAGGSATFTMVLTSQPSADVSVSFDTDDSSEGAPSATSKTFTQANWNVPQTITVTGADDGVADGDATYHIVFSATTSADAAYAAITPAPVAVTNTDNDTAGINVSTISGPTTEAGGNATFSVTLASQPTADVTVHFASDNSAEARDRGLEQDLHGLELERAPDRYGHWRGRLRGRRRWHLSHRLQYHD